MSEPVSEQPGAPDEATSDADAGNLTVEDDPQGTTDPADLAGSGGAGDDGVE